MKYLYSILVIVLLLTNSCERYIPDTLGEEDKATFVKDSTTFEELLQIRSFLISNRDSIKNTAELSNNNKLLIDSLFISNSTPTHYKGSISFYAKHIMYLNKNENENYMSRKLVLGLKKDVNNTDTLKISDTLHCPGGLNILNQEIKYQIKGNLVDQVYIFDVSKGIHKPDSSSIQTKYGAFNVNSHNDIYLRAESYNRNLNLLDSIRKSISFYQEKWPKGFKSK